MKLCRQPTLGPIFVLLAIIQIFSLCIFLKGFLLTRQTLGDLTGQTYPPWDRFPLHHVSSSSQKPPSIPARSAFKRAIIILIDALRFDFVLPNTTSHAYFLNHFPVLHQLHQTHPESSLLFQFRADPPTTTMQRIKGLMTGSLPTFIDAGSNFDSSAVTEDHLLRHIATRYHNRYFMGDDTWVTLFPESFVANQTWALESFKMLDLDSVDNAIEAQLWPLLNNNETHWELIITHFLGVDHCGHTYGPSNPHMSRKLQQMNTVIERLLEHVDNDTLLVIMGDHGMSSEGDHGGESVEELTSTLFLHSERRLTHIQNKEFYKRIHDKRSQLLGYELSDITKRLNYDASKHPIVAQIHLVPTLAYLLQVPIPFGNLGAIIPDVLYPLEKTDQQDYLWHMAEQFRINALQVHDYLQQYTQNTHHLDFSEDKLESMYAYLYKAEEILFQLLEQQSNDITRQLEEAILAYDHFLISTINYCKTIWAQFDTGSMILGLMLLGLNTLLTLIAALKMTWITTWPKMLTILSGIVAVMGGSSYYFIDTILQLIPVHWFEKMGKEDWIATSIIVSILLSFIILLLRKERDTKMLATTVTVGCIVLRGCTLGSNSFVVWEDQSTEFILATLSVAWTLSNLFSIINQQASMNHSWKSKVIQFLNAIFHPLLFLILVRLLSVIGQCREEQFPYCHYLQSNDLLEFGFEKPQGYITIGILAITYGIIVYHFGELHRQEGVIVAGSYQICGLIVLVHIIDEIAQKYLAEHGGQQTLPLVWRKYMDIYLPRLLYGLWALGSLKSWWSNRKNIDRFGWSFLLLTSTMLAILQHPLGAITIMCISPLLITLLTYNKNRWIHTTLLHFLGYHLFFVTGHQATFTSLPWKAAFVGFDEVNYYGGSILLLLSTFAGHIITWIGWLTIKDKQSYGKLLYTLVLFESIPTFLCAVFIFVLRRHLMTWKIFAPRFLFQIAVDIGAHIVAFFLQKVQ